jgi:predicted dehydrogenase
MRVVLVGLGNQGRKRLGLLGDEVVATVDPVVPQASFRTIFQVPLDSFDAALVCTPDDAKLEILEYLLSHGKHSLVEKPLLGRADHGLGKLVKLVEQREAVCHTAYNHRFEPHIVRLKEILDSGDLGRIYLTRMFYGNGTAANVKGTWRDKGHGVLSDLGCHLLDLALFLFGSRTSAFEAWGLHRQENYAYDHVVFGSNDSPALEFEATLLSWRNTFAIDVIGELGSAHVDGLRKWGPSTLTVRRRVFPSGRPREQVEVSEGPDLTWEAEYRYFKHLCTDGGATVERDLWIAAAIAAVEDSAVSANGGNVGNVRAGSGVPDKGHGFGR